MFVNKLSRFFVLLFSVFFINTAAQTFVFEPADTVLTDSVNAEIIFDFELTNISSEDINVVVERTENITPASWSSSLCFFENCYAPFIDSVSTRISPGSSIPFSVHVFALSEEGTATVTVEAFKEGDKSELYEYTLTANAVLTSVNAEEKIPNHFVLEQNYPNPFNPSTNIKFGIPKFSGNQKVILKIYDLLGKEVKTLVDDYLAPGNYEVQFDASDFSSGIYFYQLSAGEMLLTNKMILEK